MKPLAMIVAIIGVVLLVSARFAPVTSTPFMNSETWRLGHIQYQWIETDELPIYVKTSVMAGEDARFCKHHGVEWGILWQVAKEGGKRGGSTITQQMVKNLWLWHGRSWISKALRKVIELPLTLIAEIFLPKERILELYLNIVEFDEGVFGIEAAAWHHYHRPAKDLTREQMARLAAVLPNPAAYQAVPPDAYVRRRAPQIARGARDIEALDLDECVRMN